MIRKQSLLTSIHSKSYCKGLQHLVSSILNLHSKTRRFLASPYLYLSVRKPDRRSFSTPSALPPQEIEVIGCPSQYKKTNIFAEHRNIYLCLNNNASKDVKSQFYQHTCRIFSEKMLNCCFTRQVIGIMFGLYVATILLVSPKKGNKYMYEETVHLPNM